MKSERGIILIAGAILLSILVLATGMYTYNSASVRTTSISTKDLESRTQTNKTSMAKDDFVTAMAKIQTNYYRSSSTNDDAEDYLTIDNLEDELPSSYIVNSIVYDEDDGIFTIEIESSDGATYEAEVTEQLTVRSFNEV